MASGRRFTARNGAAAKDVDLARVTVREADIADAAVLKTLGDRLLTETENFIREPQERAASPEAMAQVIRGFREARRSALYNAWHDGRPIGEGVLMAGQLVRTAHVATIGLGVLKRYHGTGVADLLMEALEKRARAEGILRLELTVMAENSRARRFYERHGFAYEGTRTGSVRIKGRLVDEDMMARHLPSAGGDSPT